MYDFESPFNVKFQAFHHLRFSLFEDIKPNQITVKHNGFEINVSLEKIKFNNCFIGYSFQINKEIMIETIKYKEIKIILKSHIPYEIQEAFIEQLFQFYGIVSYGRLSSVPRDKKEIMEKAKEIIKKDGRIDIYQNFGKVILSMKPIKYSVEMDIHQTGIYQLNAYSTALEIDTSNIQLYIENINCDVDEESKRNKIKERVEETEKIAKVFEKIIEKNRLRFF